MAETTTEVIFKVGTDQAVKNIADLKNNIKEYKKALEELEIGSTEYQETLEELNVNQAALKNAMYATSATMEEVAAAAKAANIEFDENNELVKTETVSYNELVKKMADLKTAFRSTTSETERNKLATQIKSINDRLKEMDATQGNFQRNVGDYFNQVTVPLKSVIQDLPSSMGPVKQIMDDTTKSLGLMGKQPIIGMIALLSPMLVKIMESLKGNKTMMDAIKKAMDALKPIMDFMSGIIEKIAQWLSTAIDYFISLAGESGGTFSKIVAGAVGVGNAILQFLLTPIRNVIDAAKALGDVIGKVFKGQFKEAADSAKAALGEIKDNFKKGFDFAANFKEGQKIGEQFVAGLSSLGNQANAEKAGKKVGEKAAKAATKAAKKELAEWMKREDETWAEWWDRQVQIAERKEKEREAKMAERRKVAQELEKENAAFAAELAKQAEEETARALEEIQNVLDAELAAQQKAMEEAQQRQENFKNGLQQSIAGVSGIMGTLADMIEGGTEVTEKEARRAKNLRIASAMIDMYQGATTAYSTAQSLGVPMGPIVGAINAAAVVATGMANIAKIKAQNVSASSGGSSTAAPAVTTPSISPQVSQVRTITSASEEQRLDQMASDQKVYILNSDLEAAAKSRRVLATETSF